MQMLNDVNVIVKLEITFFFNVKTMKSNVKKLLRFLRTVKAEQNSFLLFVINFLSFFMKTESRDV